MKSRSIYIAILFLLMPVLAGCGASQTAKSPTPQTQKETGQEAAQTQDAAEEYGEPGTDQPAEGTPETKKPADSAAADTKSLNQSEPMPMTIDKTKKYSAILKTDAGDIEIALTADKTPITVNNFVGLAQKDFYNNTVFHRVIKDFMIQGGDPKGDGTGGPGCKFEDEPFEGEYVRGTVAMANSGPNTNGSQFFIMHKDTPLPKSYVIFGTVTSGLEAVDKIAEVKTEMSPNGEMSKPVTPVKVNSVQIKIAD